MVIDKKIRKKNIDNNIVLIGGDWKKFFVCGYSKCKKEEEEEKDPQPLPPTAVNDKDFNKKFDIWDKEYKAWQKRNDLKSKEMMDSAIKNINTVSGYLDKPIEQSLSDEDLELELLELDFDLEDNLSQSNKIGGGLCGSKNLNEEENQETECDPNEKENIVIALYVAIIELGRTKTKLQRDIKTLESEIKNKAIVKSIRLNKLKSKKSKERQIEDINNKRLQKIKIIKLMVLKFGLNQADLQSKARAQSQSKGGNKQIRRHRGIHQTGGNKGKLKKGYKYSGKRLKNGKAEIVPRKTRKTRKTKK